MQVPGCQGLALTLQIEGSTGDIPGATYQEKSRFCSSDSQRRISQGFLGQKAELTFFRWGRVRKVS